MKFARVFLTLLLSTGALGCASQPSKGRSVSAPAPMPDYEALVAAEDRSPEDRALDPSRRPTELLRFIGVRRGDRVAELGAGTGYTAELLARAVGPEGKVYAQNPEIVIEKFAREKWPARLAKPINRSVVRVDREFDDPLPADATGLDAVVMNLFYHDLFWFGTDRVAMNKAILRALKPGGVFVVIDHSGRPGTGTSEVKTLHRIEERVVRDELVAAGFQPAGEGDFLRNEDDTRDWMVFEEDKRGRTDRFVLKFVKP